MHSNTRDLSAVLGAGEWMVVLLDGSRHVLPPDRIIAKDHIQFEAEGKVVVLPFTAISQVIGL